MEKKKKGLQSPIFGGADQHCVISQSCLLSELPQDFTHPFMRPAGPQTNQGHCLPQQQPLLQAGQMVEAPSTLPSHFHSNVVFLLEKKMS